MKIAFLHTADVHKATFDTLLTGSGVEVAHVVRADLLARAQAKGVSAVRDETIAILHGLSDADAVVCTCSTLGEIAANMSAPHILRIDRPAFEAAVAFGSRILLVICLKSTQDASEALLAGCGADLQTDTLICVDAWPYFVAGDLARFSHTIAADVRKAVSETPYDAVILAQASMKDAASLLADIGVPVLSTPKMAVDAALALVRARATR